MDRSFHYLIMINHALFQKRALEALTAIGLTPGQPKVLDYLRQHNGRMQKEVAHGCQIDPATLTGILARMEEKGLVERRMLNGNRRSSYVYLTDLGKEKSDKVSEVFLEVEAAIFKGISENDRKQFMEVFHKISCNMTIQKELK